MPALTRRDLDVASCQVPGCKHEDHEGLFLHARCHPSAGTRVEYRDGELAIRCRTCETLVCKVRVAS